MTDLKQTALAEFADGSTGEDDVDDVDPVTGAGSDSPTPVENARDIGRLVDLMQELTDQVATIVDDGSQPETPRYRAEEIDSSPKGMFQ
jgi:hypothetical protein